MNTIASESRIPYGVGNGLFYLWHMQSIGLIDANEALNDFWIDSLDLEGHQPVRVAIIDNGCTQMEHPNLPGSRIVKPMEFAGFLEGAVYGTSAAWTRWGDSDDLRRLDLRKLLQKHGGVSKPLRDTIYALSEGTLSPHCYSKIANPCDRFAAHGTAVAGLVAAEAEAVADDPDKQTAKEAELRRRFPTKINYSGINPLAEIIPINTVYDNSYGPVIMALLYAVDQKADVVLIPRAVAEIDKVYSDQELIETDAPRATRLQSQEREADMELFEHVLKIVSEQIPTVVAAGNDGRAAVKYPGRLKVAPATTGDPHGSLFVAGAATASGSLSSYSSGGNEDKVIFMPSDDAPIINDWFFRPDPNAWNTRHIKSVSSTQSDPFPFTPYALLSIDIPGQFGYASEGKLNTDYEGGFAENATYIYRTSLDGSKKRTLEAAPRSLYSMFGGTSGASAILAGVLSLCQNIYRRQHGERARLSGSALSRLVGAAGTRDFVPLVTFEDVDPKHQARPKTIDIKQLFDEVKKAAAPT